LPWGIGKLIRLILVLNPADAVQAEIALSVVDDNGFGWFCCVVCLHELDSPFEMTIFMRETTLVEFHGSGEKNCLGTCSSLLSQLIVDTVHWNAVFWCDEVPLLKVLSDERVWFHPFASSPFDVPGFLFPPNPFRVI
jgi:hypothetical protein